MQITTTQRLLSRSFGAVVSIALSIFFATTSAQSQTLYIVSEDWSYDQNPNGVWSYHDAGGNVIQNVVDDWLPGDFNPGQRAWTDAGQVGVPGMMLSADVANGLDFPPGKVGAHGKTTLRWTAPEDGNVTLFGGTWLMRNIGRSQEIQVIYNESTVFIRTPLISDGQEPLEFDSFLPNSFANGAGGEDALTFGVRAGDTLDFTNQQQGAGDDFIVYEVEVDFDATATPLPPPSETVVFNAASDWSYANNPNGSWSYHDGNGNLMETVVDDWLAPLDFANGQRAWSNAGQGGVPGWMLSAGVANGERIPDFPEGHVGTHGKSVLRWTASADGNVTLSGGTWLLRNIGRNQIIEIRHNETLFLTTLLPSLQNPTFTSDNPQSFANGPRGESGLTFGVRQGDRIDFTNNQQGAGDDFIGYDVTIRFQPTDMPLPAPRTVEDLTIYEAAADWSDAQNPNDVWSYHEGDGTLIETIVDDWLSPVDFAVGQRAWTNAGQGGVPGWMLSAGVANGDRIPDFPAGRVGTHGPSLLRWTAPADGDVLLSGGTWLPRNIGRNVTPEVRYNGTTFIDTPLVSEEPPTYTSANIKSFADGPLGESALLFGVRDGDQLDFAQAEGANDFVGYDIRIEFTGEFTIDPPVVDTRTTFDIAGEWSWEDNPNGVWSLLDQNGDLIRRVEEDWSSPFDFQEGQRAWTNAGRVAPPAWMLSEGVANTLDFPEGFVGMHGPATLRWTAPGDGNVEIEGTVWLMRAIGRRQEINVIYDESFEFLTLELVQRPPDSANPLFLEDGPQGPDPLTFGVRTGKTIDFTSTQLGAGDDYIVFDVIVDFDPTDDPLPEPVPPTTTYDAAADFSYDANPSGAWSYLDGDGATIGSVVDDWLPGDFNPGQRAWTNAGQGGVPGWMVSAGVGIDKDFPAGRLGTHGKSILRWTAPSDGNVDLSASAWLMRDIGRPQEIHAIYNNDVIFRAAAVDSRPPNDLTFNSASPRSLASGMEFGVRAGDTIDFTNVELGGGDDFVGYDVTIVFLPIDVPAGLLPPPQPIVRVTEPTSFDAAADWSYDSNPDGPWSYHDGNGLLMENVVEEWLPGDFELGQRAWTNSGENGVPGWFLSSASANTLDFPEDTVGCHGRAILRWTAPNSGNVTISGGTWLGRNIGRSQVVRCAYNDSIGVFALDLPSEDFPVFTSLDPLFFEDGPRGAAALTFGVLTGDTLEFQNDQQGSGDDFIGYDVTIDFTPTDDPLSPPSTPEICDNGVDDDGDGDIDGADDECPTGVGPFLRGDCDGNSTVGGSPTEAIVGLNFSFRGGPAPPCLAACDAEQNGTLGITDYLRILRHSFLGIGEPDPPFPDCVTSDLETDVELGCEMPSVCP